MGRAGIGKYPPHFQWQRTKQKEIAKGNKFKPKLESSNEKVRFSMFARDLWRRIPISSGLPDAPVSPAIPVKSHPRSSKQWQRAPTCRGGTSAWAAAPLSCGCGRAPTVPHLRTGSIEGTTLAGSLLNSRPMLRPPGAVVAWKLFDEMPTRAEQWMESFAR